MFGREIINYTVIYGVYVRFWPTLLRWLCDIAHIITLLHTDIVALEDRYLIV
jgi:hypothetical protein